MTTITTDADYQSAIKTLLKEVGQYIEYPESLIGEDARDRLLHLVVASVRSVTNSEPHLRGALLDGLTKMRELDTQKIEKERDAYRTVAHELHAVLSEIPAARLGRGTQVRRKMALELANKTL